MPNDHISVRATIDFVFNTDPDLTVAELIAELEDRIRNGEFFPHDVVRLSVETNIQVNK